MSVTKLDPGGTPLFLFFFNFLIEHEEDSALGGSVMDKCVLTNTQCFVILQPGCKHGSLTHV